MKRRRSRAGTPAPAETILGIGVDVVESERVRRAIVNWGDRFLSRVFRGEERAYCEAQSAPWRHFAGRFAVKEAVAKAFGTGIGDRVGWRDIQVIRNSQTGAPGVRLCGAAARWAQRRGILRIHVSITHSHSLAIAVVVLMGHPPDESADGGGLSPATRSDPPSS